MRRAHAAIRRPVRCAGVHDPGVHDIVVFPRQTGVRRSFLVSGLFADMMKRERFAIGSIYVPQARRATLDPAKVHALAASILDDGLQMPILLRPDGTRYVLVEGLHRLEACRALGETTIDGYLVQARRH